MVKAMLNTIAITVTANIIAKMFTMMGSSGMGSSSTSFIGLMFNRPVYADAVQIFLKKT